MVGKDLDIAAEIVGVESDDEGNRVVTVQLTENGAYAGKSSLRLQVRTAKTACG